MIYSSSMHQLPTQCQQGGVGSMPEPETRPGLPKAQPVRPIRSLGRKGLSEKAQGSLLA